MPSLGLQGFNLVHYVVSINSNTVEAIAIATSTLSRITVVLMSINHALGGGMGPALAPPGWGLAGGPW